jgi:hypothetical protein
MHVIVSARNAMINGMRFTPALLRLSQTKRSDLILPNPSSGLTPHLLRV